MEREGTQAREEGADRRRLALALGAAALLAAVVVVAALTASSGSPAADQPEDCFEAWNGSDRALADGQHAFSQHGYRDTLVARVDEAGELLPADAEPDDGRCAVVFAAEEAGFEPDFGVRVLATGGWVGLFLSEGLTVPRIEALQREALESANARLEPDGSLAEL